MDPRHRPISTLALGAALLVGLAEPVLAQTHQHAGMRPAPVTDSAAVAAAILSFHEALRAADTTAVLRLLGDDVVVAESGDVESG